MRVFALGLVLLVGCSWDPPKESNRQEPTEETAGSGGAIAGATGAIGEAGEGGDPGDGGEGGANDGEPAGGSGGRATGHAGRGGAGGARSGSAGAGGELGGAGGTGSSGHAAGASGATAAGGAHSAGSGGATVAKEELMLLLESPDSTYSGPIASSSSESGRSVFHVDVSSDSLASGNCSSLLKVEFNNQAIGTTPGAIAAAQASCFGKDSNVVAVFTLPLNNGGDFSQRGDQRQHLDLSGYLATRWEVEVTTNQWGPAPGAVWGLYWNAGFKFRLYGRAK
jgi:hypothetical protein